MENKKCREVVEMGKKIEDPTPNFIDRTMTCSEFLTRWDRVEFRNIGKRVRMVREKLKELQHGDQDGRTIAECRSLKTTLDDLLKRKKSFGSSDLALCGLKMVTATQLFSIEKRPIFMRKKESIVSRTIMGVGWQERKKWEGFLGISTLSCSLLTDFVTCTKE